MLLPSWFNQLGCCIIIVGLTMRTLMVVLVGIVFVFILHITSLAVFIVNTSVLNICYFCWL